MCRIKKTVSIERFERESKELTTTLENLSKQFDEPWIEESLDMVRKVKDVAYFMTERNTPKFKVEIHRVGEEVEETLMTLAELSVMAAEEFWEDSECYDVSIEGVGIFFKDADEGEKRYFKRMFIV